MLESRRYKLMPSISRAMPLGREVLLEEIPNRMKMVGLEPLPERDIRQVLTLMAREGVIRRERIPEKDEAKYSWTRLYPIEDIETWCEPVGLDYKE
jgi:hypothetical protein